MIVFYATNFKNFSGYFRNEAQATMAAKRFLKSEVKKATEEMKTFDTVPFVASINISRVDLGKISKDDVLSMLNYPDQPIGHSMSRGLIKPTKYG